MSNSTTTHMMIGYIYYLKYMDILSFLLESLNPLAESLKFEALSVNSFKFLSLFNSISNDFVIISDTSDNS